MSKESELLSVLKDSMHGKELTARKTSELLEKRNYVITGFVITDSRGDIGIIDKSAVRWMARDKFFAFMQNPNPS